MTFTINYRLFVIFLFLLKMKVTVVIPDELVKEAQVLSNAKTITETLIIALKSYVSFQKLKEMGEEIKRNPLKFEYSAQEIRELNR